MALSKRQSKRILVIADRTYSWDIDDHVEALSGVNKTSPLQTGDFPIQWDFQTGDVLYGSSVPYAYASPGNYDLRISFYENNSKRPRTTTRRVRVGFDTERLGDPEDPYAKGGAVFASTFKYLGDDGAARVGFVFSPYLSAGINDPGPVGDPDWSVDGDAFYNLVTRIEQHVASKVVRFPIAVPEDLEEGMYGVFPYDLIYIGKSDTLSEHLRKLKKRLKCDILSPPNEAHAYRVFTQLRTAGGAMPQVLVTHPFRPYGVLFSEGAGLRLAMSEAEQAFDEKATTDLTVREQKEILSPTEKEERDRQSYTHGAVHALLWDLSRICYQYFQDLNLPYPSDPATTNQIVMAVLNCTDLSLSVRLYSWNDDDPYAGWELWRHVTTQLRFAPTPEAVGRITPGHMYADTTGDPTVRILPHEEAEALLGETLPLDFKVVHTRAGLHLLDPKRQVLSPLNGGRGGGGMRAFLLTRGGGSMTRPLPNGETFFLGSMVTVDGYAAPSQELRERWKGLTDKTEIADDIVAEGVDPSYQLTARAGLAGGQINVYNPDPSDPAENFSNVELGPKDFGRYETIDPGVSAFPREQTGGFRLSQEAKRYTGNTTSGVAARPHSRAFAEAVLARAEARQQYRYAKEGAVDPSNWRPGPSGAKK